MQNDFITESLGTPEKHRMALEVMKSCQVDIVNAGIPVYDIDKHLICILTESEK